MAEQARRDPTRCPFCHRGFDHWLKLSCVSCAASYHLGCIAESTSRRCVLCGQRVVREDNARVRAVETRGKDLSIRRRSPLWFNLCLYGVLGGELFLILSQGGRHWKLYLFGLVITLLGWVVYTVRRDVPLVPGAIRARFWRTALADPDRPTAAERLAARRRRRLQVQVGKLKQADDAPPRDPPAKRRSSVL